MAVGVQRKSAKRPPANTREERLIGGLAHELAGLNTRVLILEKALAEREWIQGRFLKNTDADTELVGRGFSKKARS